MKYSPLLPTGWLLSCVVAGTTSAGEIVLPSPVVENASVVDGTVTWEIRKIADAQELAGKADRRLSNLDTANLACHVVVDSYYNETTGDWYRVYDDGWTEQGGYVASNTSTNEQTATFLKPFSKVCTCLIPPTMPENQSSHVFLISANNTGFTYHGANTEDNTWAYSPQIWWYACGMGVTA
jgi:hypothetical protein